MTIIGWKSDAVAEGYIRDSKKLKIDNANLLSLEEPKKPQSSQDSSSSFFSNCNVTFNNCTVLLPNANPTHSDVLSEHK